MKKRIKMKTKEQLWDDIMTSLQREVFHIHHHSNPKLIENLIEQERERQIAWYIVNRDFILNSSIEDDYLESVLDDYNKIKVEEAIEKRLDKNQ